MILIKKQALLNNLYRYIFLKKVVDGNIEPQNLYLHMDHF